MNNTIQNTNNSARIARIERLTTFDSPKKARNSSRKINFEKSKELESVALINLDEFQEPKKQIQGEFSGDLDNIINSAIQLAQNGYSHLLITSAQKLFVETDIVSYLIYSIKRHTDIEITLCLGKRNFPDLKNWKIAGADNYIYFINDESDNNYSASHDCRNQIECIRKSGLGVHVGFYIEKELGSDDGLTKILQSLRSEKPDAVVPALPGGLSAALTDKVENLLVRLRYFVLMLRTYFKELDIYYCNYWDDDESSIKSELQFLGATKIITRHR